MRLCSVPNCNNIHLAKGFCIKHYFNFRKYGKPLHIDTYHTVKYCTVKECSNIHYAKGYCHKHWAYFLNQKRKYGHQHKCKIETCFNRTIKSYCSRHQYRIIHNLPLDLSFDARHLRKGKNNNRWNKGSSEYPNHYLMKKNRKIVLKNNPFCSCGNKAKLVHHKDGSKTNHSINNLQPMCFKCHGKTFPKTHTSKFIKIYGHTLVGISKKFNIPYAKILKFHKENKLRKFLTFGKLDL